MKTHNYTVDFTNLNEISDRTTVDPYTGEPVESENDEPATESSIEMEEVRELLHELSELFDSRKKVRPTCPQVQKLLCIAGKNSWAEFQSSFAKELDEFFSDETPTIDIDGNVNADFLDQAIKELENVKKMIADREKAIKTHAVAKQTLTNKLAAAELQRDATDGLEWDEESKTKHLQAKKMIVAIQAKLKEIEKQNPEQGLKFLYVNQRRLQGKMEFAKKLLQGNVVAYVNTGDPKIDAGAYRKLAEDAVWNIVGLEEQEMKARDRDRKSRFSGADFYGEARHGQEFEDTNGGVFSKALEDIQRYQKAQENYGLLYSAAEHGYEYAAAAFIPTYEREWFPEWIEFEPARKQALARKQQSAVTRAQQQYQAANELRKR